MYIFGGHQRDETRNPAEWEAACCGRGKRGECRERGRKYAEDLISRGNKSTEIRSRCDRNSRDAIVNYVDKSVIDNRKRERETRKGEGKSVSKAGGDGKDTRAPAIPKYTITAKLIINRAANWINRSLQLSFRSTGRFPSITRQAH